MGVEVGGRLFVTSRDTLKKHPTSRLAMLVDSKPTYIQDGLPVLFIDCDTQFFKIILHFCRDGHRNIHSHLTPVSFDKSILKQIEYYRLDSLTDIIISSQLSVLLMGHIEFLEEWDTKKMGLCGVVIIFFIRNCEHSDCLNIYLNLLLIYINNKM